jgi:hypothetical protein
VNTRARLIRLAVLVGMALIGVYLFRVNPRDVTLVYGLQGKPVRTLDVEIDKDGRQIRRAEFPLAGTGGQVIHHVRLPDGEYVLHFTLSGDGAPRRLERPISVTESGTIVLPLSD